MLKGGHSRSSAVAPFDSSRITSHSSSRVTTAVACTICEIFAFKLLGDLETGGWSHSRSSKVQPLDSLCMVTYSTYIATMAVSHTISGIHQLTGQKSHNFLTLLVFSTPLRVKPSELRNDPRWYKTRMMGLSGGKRILTKGLAILTQSTCVTQTYRQQMEMS